MSSQQDPPPPSRGNLSPVEETGRPASVNSTGQLSSTATTAGATTYAPINTQSSSRAPLSRPRFLSIDTGASQQPSIRIRRFPSQQNIQAVAASQQQNTATRDYAPDSQVSQLQHNVSTRRRSSSEPQRLHLNSPEFRTRGLSNAGAQPYMPNIAEGGISASNLAPAPSAETQRLPLKKSRTRLFRTSSQPKPTEEELRRSEYESNLVDVLDLVDPEVSTLNTLTNVQNSLFVPQLGWLVNRRPTYTLTRREQELPLPPTPPEAPPHTPVEETEDDRRTRLGRSSTLDSITSRPDERHYAVLPHGIALEGWSPEDREELNDHVRHMLHSRRSRFKRSMKGFGQYMSKREW
ncbi:hypothetical protein PVAG01_04193 [Phlyctema vagabunda]|uniref:Uncharacterized protein n=1 Tax=Phlyctema vagabunda TaxID=108571 RepID=A0ABR4PP63_9HELO